MSEASAASRIDEEAAVWALRADAQNLDPERDAELSAWLAADPRRRGAFLRAQAALLMVDRTRALPDPALETPSPAVKMGRRRFLAAALAGTGAAGVAGLAIWRGLAPELHFTPLGEVRRTPLADGTLMVLNTDTAVEVRLSRTRRLVRLVRGEAWFDIAHDSSRPFVVEAGGAQFRAVGTAFSVRRSGDGNRLQVTDGTVEAWSQANSRPARVVAGQTALLVEGEAKVMITDDPAAVRRSLAWRQGELVLDGETLREAAAEFNRYNQIKIEVADPGLGQQRLVGLFRTTDPESFAEATANVLQARVERHGDLLRIERR